MSVPSVIIRPASQTTSAGAERAHVDEGAAGEHQAADADEHDRGMRTPRPPIAASSQSTNVLADRRRRPSRVEDRREEEPERDQAEPDELGMVMSASARPPSVVRFFTREGVRRRSGRFLRLAAMPATLRRPRPGVLRHSPRAMGLAVNRRAG